MTTEPERERSINNLMEQMRRDLYNVVDNYVEILRERALTSFPSELSEKQWDDPKLNSSLYSLPWKEVGKMRFRPANQLARHLRRRREEAKVGDVWDLFNSVGEGRILPSIRNYGSKSLQVTYEVFRRAGLELPHTTLYHH